MYYLVVVCYRISKAENVLDEMSKNKQPGVKEMICQIWMADTRENANRTFDQSLETNRAKYAEA